MWRQGIRHNFDVRCIAAVYSGSVSAPSRDQDRMQDVDSSWNVMAYGRLVYLYQYFRGVTEQNQEDKPIVFETVQQPLLA